MYVSGNATSVIVDAKFKMPAKKQSLALKRRAQLIRISVFLNAWHFKIP
jgi:hypothetical protein